MDETKVFQNRTRQRISSLPEKFSKEVCTSVEKIRHTSGAELPRNFRKGKRHSIDSPYCSSRRDLTEEFEFLITDSFEFYTKPREEEEDTTKETNSEMGTRLAHFPALKSPVTCDLPPSRKTAIFNRMHSWNDYERGESRRTSNIERPWVKEEGTVALSPPTGSTPSLPRIRRVMRDSGRFSFPISTENTKEPHSTSFLSKVNLVEGRELQTEAAHPSPSLAHASFINPTTKQSDELTLDETDNPAKLFARDMEAFNCNRANHIRLSGNVKTDESVEENEKAQALRTYVEDVTADFNEVETKAAMLLEWLRDQSSMNP